MSHAESLFSPAQQAQSREQWRASLVPLDPTDLHHALELVRLGGKVTDEEQRNAVDRLRVRNMRARLARQEALDARRIPNWDAYREKFNRGELLDLFKAAVRHQDRTGREQSALLTISALLDGAFEMLGAEARETHRRRMHICECGTRTEQYWCSRGCWDEDGDDHSDDDYDDEPA